MEYVSRGVLQGSFLVCANQHLLLPGGKAYIVITCKENRLGDRDKPLFRADRGFIEEGVSKHYLYMVKNHVVHLGSKKGGCAYVVWDSLLGNSKV